MLDRLYIGFVFAAWSTLPAICAFELNTPVSEYLHRSWTPAEGFPGMVSAIARTKDGYLWLATQHGVVRFDGTGFTIFTPENSPGLKSGYVITLLAGRLGDLWVGTYGGGVSRFDHGKFETYTTKEGLSSDLVKSLYEDRDGNVLIGTYDGALNRMSHGKITTILQAQPGEHSVTAMLEDKRGRLWLAEAAGILCLEHGKSTRYELHDGARTFGAVAILSDNDGNLWFGTRIGLYRLEEGNFGRLWPKVLVHEDPVWSVARDRDGAIWFGTAAGIKRFRNGRVDSYRARDGLSADDVYAVMPDDDGNVWVGTIGGFDRLADRPIHSYSTKQGLTANQVWSVVEDHQGAVWVGTNGGLDRIEGGSIRSYTTKNGLPSNVVYSVREGPDRSIWFTTERGLCRLKNGNVSVYGVKDGLSSDRVHGIDWMRDGTLIVSPDPTGLFSLRDGRFVPILTLPEYVHSISNGTDGSVWLSTFGELVRWKDNHVTEYGTPSDMYSYSYEDRAGTVWAGSVYGGLVCIKGGKLIRFAPLGPPFNDRVFHIFEDRIGNLWVTTPHGLFRIKKTELTHYAEGMAKQVFAAEFGLADGLPSNGCNGGEQNAGWTDSQGRFWIPTGRGVAVLDPRQVTVDTKPPRTIIEQVIVDDEAIAVATAPKLSPDHKRIQFRYTGIDFRAPEGVRFRYQLEGFDKGWVNGGSNKEVSYTGLRPGAYRFRVIARNRDGLWDHRGASFSFRVAPHFYYTPWFYSLCAIAIALTAGAGHFWRVRQIREKAEIAMAERTRMAREIHDTLLQGVSGTSLVLEAIAPAITDGEIRRRFDNALNEMQRCMTDTRRALWDMRSHEPESSDFIVLLDHYGHALTSGTEIRFLLEVNGTPGLPSEMQKNLLRIGQEAILNAVKHSSASEIRVAVSATPDSVDLRVDDNGRGFDSDTASRQTPGHWGLLGMRERAKELAAEFSISSAPGRGTRVEATILFGSGKERVPFSRRMGRT